MKKIIAVFLAFSLLLVTGCTGKTQENKKQNLIAVSFYPIYVFTLNLVSGIDEIEVKTIAEQNDGCLHDYTVTAKDAKLLNDADVFVINGAGMEGFVDDLYETIDDFLVIDSSKGVELICTEEHHHEEHHDEHHEEHSSFAHHHHHSFNSHIWMSVKNAKIQVENIKNGLIEVYPNFEKEINKNYKDYILRLDNLEKEMQEKAKGLQNQNIMTFHNAYTYMAKDLNLNIVDCIEGGAHGGEPSAKKLALLSEKINDMNVKALFTEPKYKGSAANILSEETGVKVFTLNPVTSGNGALTAYEDTMRENIEIIIKAVK